MQESQKYIDVVVKLNRLTTEDKLTWEDASSISEKRYRTRHQNKYFVIYEPRPNPLLRQSDKPQTDLLMDILLSKTMSKASLAIEDGEGNTIFTFPSYSLIDDLMRTIESKMNVSEADAFLDNFLEEDL